LLILVAPVWFVIAEQAVPAPDTPLSWITSGGIVGLLAFMVVAFLREWIVPGDRYRESQRELAEVQRFMRDEAIPLLSRVQEVLARTLEERAWDDRHRRDQR
jgi:hypothetical protein